jgi:hypothetical protein
VLESKGDCSQKIIEAWESTIDLRCSGQILDCEYDVLEMEKNLKEKVVESVVSKEAQALV